VWREGAFHSTALVHLTMLCWGLPYIMWRRGVLVPLPNSEVRNLVITSLLRFSKVLVSVGSFV